MRAQGQTHDFLASKPPLRVALGNTLNLLQQSGAVLDQQLQAFAEVMVLVIGMTLLTTGELAAPSGAPGDPIPGLDELGI